MLHFRSQGLQHAVQLLVLFSLAPKCIIGYGVVGQSRMLGL